MRGQYRGCDVGAEINFAPGSSNIELASSKTVDKIAEILKGCPDVAMEIGGYTDSQGREEMNKALSQRRAEAVLTALLARRVLTSNISAHGYGEENPIADNGTEEGREANRRIEFKLVGGSSEEESAASDEAGDTAAPEGEAAAGESADAVTTPPPSRPEVEADEAAPEGEAAPEEAAVAEGEAAPEGEAAAAEAEEPAPESEADALPDPVVVDPDLAGKRPKPRPSE
ncbi:MAG: OmpA family protein [Maritimibacter sp.]